MRDSDPADVLGVELLERDVHGDVERSSAERIFAGLLIDLLPGDSLVHGDLPEALDSASLEQVARLRRAAELLA